MSSSGDTNSEGVPDNKDNEGTESRERQFLGPAIFNPLQQIHDAAQSWITLLATLVGVSTIVGLLQGRDTFSELSILTQEVLTIIVILAFITLIGAIYNALLASEGSLSLHLMYGGRDSLSDSYDALVEKAARALKSSRFLGFISIALVMIALIVTLYAPGQPKPGTSVIVMQKSGRVECGTLAMDRGGNLLLSRVGLPPIILDDVVSFNVVSACP